MTIGYGLNTAHGEKRQGMFGEITRERSVYSVFGRAEVQQVETGLLLGRDAGQSAGAVLPSSTVAAFTVGATRQLAVLKGFDASAGVQVTFHDTPDRLVTTHGAHPASFLVFLRVRLPAPMGRMWNHRMSQGPGMAEASQASTPQPQGVGDHRH